jgi:hypothetical protein
VAVIFAFPYSGAEALQEQLRTHANLCVLYDVHLLPFHAFDERGAITLSDQRMSDAVLAF